MNQEDRLLAYEKMQRAVQTEYHSICTQMEDLKAAGKVKSVTYKTLFAKKTKYQDILAMYELYDLTLSEPDTH